MLLGCIADDLTGATDLGLTLARGGMRVVQVTGVPAPDDLPAGAEAVVVALKSRTIPAAEAVDLSLRSLDVLRAAGARQLLFKYCSTFDSTDEGNIGPVAEALLHRLGAPLALATPAFPTNGRTVYQGHLFVGGELLSESPMKDHPLTPMRDANLVRVLQRQTKVPVGLVPFADVDRGRDAIAAAFARAEADGRRLVIVDALTDRHLVEIGAAAADMPLVTGGSGIALGLPEVFRRKGLLAPRAAAARFEAPAGRSAVLAGSCSAATREQVARAEAAGLPALRLGPLGLAEGRQTPSKVLDWAAGQPAGRPVLIYSTAEPATVAEAQAALGRERRRGYAHGSTGNISARLDGGQILITPTNSCLGLLDPERIAAVAPDGSHLSGDKPSKESFLHLAMYAERPSAKGIVHLHCTHAVAVSCRCHADPRNVLPPITAYHVMRVGRLPLVPYYRPGDHRLAEAVRAEARGHHAVLLANHGPVVAGRTLEDAVFNAEELEETAKLVFLLDGRETRPLDAQQVADLEAAFPS